MVVSATLRFRRALIDEMVAHALADKPLECCGVVAVRDGEALKVHRMANTAASAVRYEVDSAELVRVYGEIDDAGCEIGAIYHSHTRSAPYPSQTDINLAFYPDALYIIVGVAGPEPEVRAFRIVEHRDVDEVPLEVV